MEVQLISSTNNYESLENALNFSRDVTRRCRNRQKSFEKIQKEENKEKLTNILLDSDHHHAFDQVSFGYDISGLSKMLAMVLNNQRISATMESSARSLTMPLSDATREKYNEWAKIFENKITNYYPQISDPSKLAKENARYLTSVFTPTAMFMTKSLREWNYTLHFFDDYIKNAPNNSFNQKLKPEMQEFIELLNPIYEKKINPNAKGIRINLFQPHFEDVPEHFGYNYVIKSHPSFAALAQMHRHRSINYEMEEFYNNSNIEYFVPAIIKDDQQLVKNWIHDLENSEDEYPQARKIGILESGDKYSRLFSKAAERLCGHSQYETMINTKETFLRYYNEILQQISKGDESLGFIFEDFKKYVSNEKNEFEVLPRCRNKHLNYICDSHCDFGPKYGIERKI